MYVPRAFQESDVEVLHDFLDQHDFATLITRDEGELAITHLPLLLDRDAGLRGRLLGHVARANPHAESLGRGLPTVAVFHGPHAYVSPAWYATHPSVPTWNYAVVHVRGTPATIEDETAVRAVLDRLVERHESPRAEPWKNDLPAEYRTRMEGAIVAFELAIEHIDGKFKLGQNRSPEDREGVARGLEAAGDPGSIALAQLQRKHSHPG